MQAQSIWVRLIPRHQLIFVGLVGIMTLAIIEAQHDMFYSDNASGVYYGIFKGTYSNFWIFHVVSIIFIVMVYTLIRLYAKE